jgi:hypothetical protein
MESLMGPLPKGVDWSFMLDKELIQVCYGKHQTQLRFDGDVCVSIEAGILHTSTGDVLGKSVAREQGMASLIGLLGSAVTSVVTDDEDVLLRLQFSNMHTLRVLRDDEPYESFSISAPGQLTIVE